MKKYGKFTDDPASPVIITALQDEEDDSALLEKGWKPLIEPVSFPAAPYFDYNYELSQDESSIVLTYSVPQRAPRTISKFKLKLAIAQARLLSQFTQLLSSFDVVEGYNALDAFNDATTLDEDNPKFAEAVELAKQALGLTDAQVEDILSNSVAE